MKQEKDLNEKEEKTAQEPAAEAQTAASEATEAENAPAAEEKEGETDPMEALEQKVAELTDRNLRRALKDELGDATVIIVAQRIGTIRDADTILVIDDGRIVGSGRHEDLLKTCPTYLEIALSQLSEEELS